jgi:hypothetical protein
MKITLKVVQDAPERGVLKSLNAARATERWDAKEITSHTGVKRGKRPHRGEIQSV